MMTHDEPQLELTDADMLGPDVIETTDEEGNVHIFEKVDEYEFDGKTYALLVYQGGDADDDEEAEGGHQHGPGCSHGSAEEGDDEGYDEEIVVMRIGYEGGEQIFEAIDDEDEFQRVVAYIERVNQLAEENGETESAETDA